MFGCGWVIGGTHTLLGSNTDALSSHAALVRVAKVTVKPHDHLTPDFWEGDGLGILPPSRCEHCRNVLKMEHVLKEIKDLLPKKKLN